MLCRNIGFFAGSRQRHAGRAIEPANYAAATPVPAVGLDATEQRSHSCTSAMQTAQLHSRAAIRICGSSVIFLLPESRRL